MDAMTLGDMQMFDFNEPVNGLVIYDDSDEDDKSIIQKNHTEYAHDDGSKILSDVPIKSEEDYSGRTEKNNTDLTNGIINLVQCVKRKLPEIEDEKVTNRKKIKNRGIIISKEKENNVISQYFPQDSIYDTNNIQNESYAKKDATQSVKIVNQSTNNSGLQQNNTNTHNIVLEHEKSFVEVADYIKDIFDTISQNLILSIKAYHDHLNKIKTNMDLSNPVVQDSKKRYLKLKYDYFQSAYCGVVNIILPQEKKRNIKFTEEFLYNTLKYAKEIMKIEYSKQDLEPFYYELISWARKKKDMLRKEFIKETENEKCRKIKENELLKKQLSQPPLLLSYLDKQNYVNQTSHIQPSHTKPSHIQPSHIQPSHIQPSHIQPSHIQPSHIQLSHTQPSLTQPSLTQPSHTQLSHTQPSHTGQSLLTPIFTGGAPNREISISIATSVVPNFVDRPQPPFQSTGPNQPPKKLHPTLQPDRYLPPNTTSSALTNALENIRQTGESQRLYNSRLHMEVSQNTALYNNMYQYNDLRRQYLDYDSQRLNLQQQFLPPQSYVNNSYPQPRHYPPPPYPCERYQNQAVSKDQTLNELTHQSTEIARSSVSTDSGCFSPLQANTVADETVPSDGNTLIPYITHVTSLNPKAAQIAEGACHVCYNRTKKMCLGCYHIYYCSTNCQKQDWKTHKLLCHTSNK